MVKITQGRGGSITTYGTATHCGLVAAWVLRRRTKDGEWRKGWVETDGGLIELVIPRHGDPLALAQDVYETAAHEWSHIKDYQVGTRDDMADKRKRHANRPWEKRAFAAASRAVRRQGASTQDVVLALALALENMREE